MTGVMRRLQWGGFWRSKEYVHLEEHICLAGGIRFRLAMLRRLVFSFLFQRQLQAQLSNTILSLL